jgi:hypothetical protein
LNDHRWTDGAETEEIGHDHDRRPLANAFLEYSRIKLVDEYWPRLRRCVETREFRPNSRNFQ